MKKLFALALLCVAASAQAAAPVGSASFVIYTDGGFFGSPGVITVRLLQNQDGTIYGGVDGGSIINLKNKAGTWEGFAYGSFAKLGCASDACEGSVSSGSTRFTVSRDSGKLSGSLNFRRFDAVNTVERIEVSADGTLTLDRRSNGEYSGQGFLPTRGFGPLRSFTATYSGSGTLERIEDPALFSIIFVNPFVLSPFAR